MTPIDRASPLPTPLKHEAPPFIIAGNIPIPRREAWHIEEEADGCGCLFAVILVGALVCLAAIFGSGCSTYTVIPADREAVPVKQTGDNPRVYTEATEDATGWYVPDAVMLELLEAE